MQNVLFPKGKEGILDGTISMTGDIRAMLVRSTYIYDPTDKFISDIEVDGPKDNGRTPPLKGKSFDLGVFNAKPTSLVALASVSCNAIILFKHTGNDATARLIAYFGSANGLPCTPAAGQKIDINWDTGPNKIFRL